MMLGKMKDEKKEQSKNEDEAAQKKKKKEYRWRGKKMIVWKDNEDCAGVWW